MARKKSYRTCEECRHPNHFAVVLRPDLGDRWKSESEGRRFRFWQLGWRLGMQAEKEHGRHARTQVRERRVELMARRVLEKERMFPSDVTSRLYLEFWAVLGYRQWFLYKGDYEAAIRQEHLLEWKCREDKS